MGCIDSIDILDILVVGGGIVGLATARALLERRPGADLLLLEQEAALASHQTGRNSGVVHSGLYYPPGSRKARLTREGGRALARFAAARGVPLREVGKVVVATVPDDLPRLDALEVRGRENGVPGLRRVGPRELREIEPAVRGLAALHLPHVAITDFRAVAAALADEVRERGGRVETGRRVLGAGRVGERWRVETSGGPVEAARMACCCGVWADRVARSAGVRPGVCIVPFRGEYRVLSSAWAARVRGLVYPVPDPGLPFLGVHLTPRLDGRVEAGPNALLALSRTGLRWRDVDLRDAWEALREPGLWRLVSRHLPAALSEVARSLSRRAFARELSRLLPGVRARDLAPGGAGIRAQALRPDGALLDDFHLVRAPGAVHVLNAPSPAATAALAIGDHVARELLAT